MNNCHDFNFIGGEKLTKIGAAWFVSYAYHEYIDVTHNNWQKISTYKSRVSKYNLTKKYHKAWLEEILNMNPNKLSTNQIDLDGNQIIEMAIKILYKIDLSNEN